MTSNQIELIYKYLADRKKNQFSIMLLEKLKSCKNDSERIHYIQKCINPKILNKIIYKKEQNNEW